MGNVQNKYYDIWLSEKDLPYFPARRTHFVPEKCDINLTCILYAGGKYYFQT
jgi:hypothetical protein